MNSSMITKFHELVGQVQFVVFEKFTSEKLCYYYLMAYMKKHHRKYRQTKFTQGMPFKLCTCVP